LYYNTTGSNGVAIGYLSQYYTNTTNTPWTNNNTAVGTQSLQGSNIPANNTGNNNTAIGYTSLVTNSTGSNNTATGYQTMYYNTTGSNNVAMGHSALVTNTTGTANVAIGFQSLYTNSTGQTNTGLGYAAGSGINTGSNNTAIGYNAQVPNGAASNQVRIGDANITSATIQVPWSSPSDRRWKDNIIDLPYGLNMVNKLRPVDYVRKNNAAGTHEIGFIAQDLEIVLKDLGYTKQGLLTKDDNGYFTVRYNDFIPVLTKAIQEQQAQIEILKAKANKIDDLQKQIDELKAMMMKK
jgi:hypothetical protein